MKSFVYGFKPFLHYEYNVTESIVQALRQRRGLTRRVFSVEFNRAQLVNAVKETRPDVVIGLGMHGRARKLRIERRAVNVQRASVRAQERAIRPGRPETLYTSLKVPPCELSTVTYDAGTYVCNFSMYVLIEHCASVGIPFAFLHVPRRMPVRTAVRFVDKLLR